MTSHSFLDIGVEYAAHFLYGVEHVVLISGKADSSGTLP
jgi:hypothetical protein